MVEGLVQLDEDPNAERQFNRAVDIVQSLPKAGPIQSSYDDKLSLYALYKQATEGPPLQSRPGIFDVLGRAKWDAWAKEKDLEKGEARERYVEVLLKVLRRYQDQPDSKAYIDELEVFVEGENLEGSRHRRPRADSSSSSSSQNSLSSFHEASAVSPDPSHHPSSSPLPAIPAAASHFLPPPIAHLHNPAIQTPSLGMPLSMSDFPVRPPSNHSGIRRPRTPARRGSDASDSSISVGGDAMSHKGRASKAGSIDGRPAGSVSALASVFEPGGGKGKAKIPVGGSSSMPGAQNSTGLGMGSSHLRTNDSPARRPSPGLLPPPSLHPTFWNSPGAASSRVSEDQPRTAPRLPHHTPIGTPQYDYRDRLSPALSILPPPVSGAPRRPLSYPNAGTIPPVDLNLALQQIQISLTALHERISALEHAQTLILTQPSDPFTTLIRSFFPSSLSHPASSRTSTAARKRSVSVRLLWRLLGTIRRAVVDVAFVLVMVSFGLGIWTGIKGRGRGGRRAILKFWGRIAGWIRIWRSVWWTLLPDFVKGGNSA